jgi:SAM-dependent methyltransferase
LTFENDAFDVVFAANSVQYAADRVAALRELKRVCVPGGRITTGVFGPPENVSFQVIQAAVRNALPTPPSGKGPYELSAPGVLEGLFEEAGLRILQSGVVDCPNTYPDFETYWQGHSSAGPFQAAIRAVGEDKLRDATREAIEVFRIDDGSYYIGPNIFKYVVAIAS